nr:uncharacterized protein LOC109169864 [Ipomoea batatas]
MKQLSGTTIIGRKRKHTSQEKENALQQTPNTADLHTPQNTKGSQSSNPLVFGVFGNSLNSPLSIVSKSGNLIKSSIRDGKGSEHILSVNKETHSQPLEYENFPLSDVTNVQQYKGKYPQRLYDSSLSRHTLTGQGHALITPSAQASILIAKDRCSQPVEIDRLSLSDLTNVQQPKGNYSQILYDSYISRVSSTQQGHIFITPTAKRTSVFSKDLDTQDSEIVRVHLSDVTNVETSTRVYRQVLTPTNNENSWNRGTGIENTQDRHSEINRNLLHDFVDASQLQNQVPPQLQGNTINANTMFWFA